jgi:hypothetical protein
MPDGMRGSDRPVRYTSGTMKTDFRDNAVQKQVYAVIPILGGTANFGSGKVEYAGSCCKGYGV